MADLHRTAQGSLEAGRPYYAAGTLTGSFAPKKNLWCPACEGSGVSRLEVFVDEHNRNGVAEVIECEACEGTGLVAQLRVFLDKGEQLAEAVTTQGERLRALLTASMEFAEAVGDALDGAFSGEGVGPDAAPGALELVDSALATFVERLPSVVIDS